MLFNSIDFAVFLPIVFILYWFGFNKNLRWQNFLVVIASYVFYAWWDWRFLWLILFSTCTDYYIGLKIPQEKTKFGKKALLAVSITVNIGLLAIFKYYNFFMENFSTAFSLFGMKISTDSLYIILPLGISFYTFQTLSYTIDIYRGKLEPCRDFISVAAFVGFFPQLVAGPIERATNLIPQFTNKRIFHYEQAVDGLRQILWGLFKKIVIADNCAKHVNLIFEAYESLSGSTLLLGAVLFAFQIYGDFSGYSDIAIGTARLFGFKLKQNFAFPYFSRDIAEFWRRWHISLSSWFRDYLYIPIGGSNGNNWFKIRNILIIFIVSGFWHGANWTFIIWGAINAIYYIPLIITGRNRRYLSIVKPGKYIPTIREIFEISLTFLMTTFAWIIFRAENISHAIGYISRIFTKGIFTRPVFPGSDNLLILLIIIFISIMIEWIGRENKHALEKLGLTWFRPFRWIIYYCILIVTLSFADKPQEFIYFQF